MSEARPQALRAGPFLRPGGGDYSHSIVAGGFELMS